MRIRIGGGTQLCEALCEVIVQAGGEVRTGAPVHRICIKEQESPVAVGVEAVLGVSLYPSDTKRQCDGGSQAESTSGLAGTSAELESAPAPAPAEPDPVGGPPGTAPSSPFTDSLPVPAPLVQYTAPVIISDVGAYTTYHQLLPNAHAAQ